MEECGIRFEIRRFCLLAGDGALLANVRIAVPEGCELPEIDSENDESESGNDAIHSKNDEIHRKNDDIHSENDGINSGNDDNDRRMKEKKGKKGKKNGFGKEKNEGNGKNGKNEKNQKKPPKPPKSPKPPKPQKQKNKKTPKAESPKNAFASPKDKKDQGYKKNGEKEAEEKTRYCLELCRDFCLAVGAGCDKFARQKLFSSIIEEYDGETDPRKRYRFSKYVYTLTFRVIVSEKKSISLLAEAKLTRGGAQISAGLDGAVVTSEGILPPELVAGKKGKKLLREHRDGVILLDRDGEPIVFYCTSNGNVSYQKAEILPLQKLQAKT